MSHRGVQYVKQEQPAFLKKFKQKVGMKPEATIADKMQEALDDCVDEEKDDEKPVVVVLKEGDLTAEEAESHDKKESPADDGKIVFKKPTKRTKEAGLSATTKKSKTDSNDAKASGARKAKDGKSKKDREKSKKKSTPASSSLLSFDENDDV